MYSLLIKEIRSFFSTAVGPIIIAVFLLLTGSFLWLIPSENNILDAGYANVDGLFALAPWLFLFLVPALTMRSFSDEYSKGTIELLLTRPISHLKIVFAKYFASLFLVVLALIPTLIYLISVMYLGASFANIDFGGFWGSFIGLFLLAAVYVAIGVFSSSLTDNAIVSFVVSAFISFLFFVGFDFISSIFSSGNIQNTISQFGMSFHYDAISRGLLDFSDICYFISLAAMFIWFSFKQKFCFKDLAFILAIIVLNIAFARFVIRIDLTSENRYTLSENTKNLMRSQSKPLDVVVYLDGDLNMGFLRLKKATENLLKELKAYSSDEFRVQFVNPALADSDKERNENYSKLQLRGLKPTAVNERDASGQLSQKIVFAWASCIADGDTINVNLLKNINNKSGEENLNISIENLEYEMTDAIRILLANNVQKVAFLEGHGELSEPYVYSITEQLARYYQVDRGVLGSDISILDDYKVVIIAAPQSEFSESDKFILDQYIMNGGRVLFVVDGVVSNDKVAIANTLNLDDMLFTYGVRIEPVALLDVQAAYVPINVALQGDQPQFEPATWYYSPLLMTSPEHSITKNMAAVRANFASFISFVGGENTAHLTKNVLLASSKNTGMQKVPFEVNTDIINLSPESKYFAYSYMPVAVVLEGKFKSVFANRLAPENINLAGRKPLSESAETKLLFIADGDIIANDVQGFGGGIEALELGYDRYMDMQFGNGAFVLNAVNYLAGDGEWLELRNREFKLRLLDKKRIISERLYWQIINLVMPLVLLFVFTVVYQLFRKKYYTK